MPIDLSNWTPKKIITVPDDRPGKIVSAEYWDFLWKSVIEQGDWSADTLDAIIDKLNITAWHPTAGAATIKNPAIYGGGSTNVSGQLSELKAFADDIVSDLNATAWHATNGAVSIKNPAIYGGGATTVKGQISELKTHMDTAEGNITTQTGRINDLLDGDLVAYNAARLGGQLPAYYGTASQITNLQNQITALQVGTISAFSHNDISNRNATGAHPQSAITGLSSTLDAINTNITNLGNGTTAAGNALKLGGALPAYYATASALTNLSNTVGGLSHASFSDRNNTASHTAAAIQYAVGTSVAQKIANMDATLAAVTGNVSSIAHADLLNRNAVDSHPISAITGLQTALDGKAASSHGTHVSYGAATTALVSGGTGAVGTAGTVARSDHTHTLPAYPTYALSTFGVTATAAELNVLDGITASVTELNYVDGVTSAIQTQLNAKQKTITFGTANPTGGVDGDIYIKYA